MHIRYDRNLRIAGIGVIPWTRLGPERWFDDYRIVSYRDGGAAGLENMPPMHLLENVRLARRNSQSMVRTGTFRQLAVGELAGYIFSTYRPVHVEDASLQSRFIINSPQHTRTYENKAWLRQTFGTELPFAPFRIFERSELESSEEIYIALQEIGPTLVLQHEQLSGGKGTYIVRDFAGYVRALESLPDEGRIVVSALIAGAAERSVQCCVSRYGTFAGSLQKQIVREPLLSNLDLPVVQGFAGGETGTVAATTAQQLVIDRCVQTIGKHMAANGYKGICGIDFLIRGEEVFILEVNARLTGLTPLLTELWQPGSGIPFYLLHMLELAGAEYSIQNADSPDLQAGSMLILHSQQQETSRISAVIEPGVYVHTEGTRLQRLRGDIHLRPEDPKAAVLVQTYATPGTTVKAGERLLTVMMRRPVLDQDDCLLPESRQLISSLYATMRFESL